MRASQLLKRNLVYYWRTNVAVVIGVAAAVAVLAGALLVGDSVRGSLRDLFLMRLGNTDYVIMASGFFREQLSEDLQNHDSPTYAGLQLTPLIEIEGSVSHETNRARAGNVRVYGVDERFWKFHGRDIRTPQGREVLISDSLAAELVTRPGDSLLVQIEKPSDVPIESLYGQKDDLGPHVAPYDTERHCLPSSWASFLLDLNRQPCAPSLYRLICCKRSWIRPRRST